MTNVTLINSIQLKDLLNTFKLCMRFHSGKSTWPVSCSNWEECYTSHTHLLINIFIPIFVFTQILWLNISCWWWFCCFKDLCFYFTCMSGLLPSCMYVHRMHIVLAEAERGCLELSRGFRAYKLAPCKSSKRSPLPRISPAPPMFLSSAVWSVVRDSVIPQSHPL